MTLPANKLVNLRRRVDRARRFPTNTCAASRHVHLMADCLSMGKRRYPMIDEEPEYIAGALYSVVESLWKARTEIERLKRKLGIDVEAEREARLQKAVEDFEKREASKGEAA